MEQVSKEEIHPDFARVLAQKSQALQSLYRAAREIVLDVYPDSNEILYHTHALSSVYSVSSRLTHAFCHIAVYTEHINLGFNQGTQLNDPHGLLKGTGAKIRHVKLASIVELENPDLLSLIAQAVEFALAANGGSAAQVRCLVSKIK